MDGLKLNHDSKSGQWCSVQKGDQNGAYSGVLVANIYAYDTSVGYKMPPLSRLLSQWSHSYARSHGGCYGKCGPREVPDTPAKLWYCVWVVILEIIKYFEYTHAYWGCIHIHCLSTFIWQTNVWSTKVAQAWFPVKAWVPYGCKQILI